MVGRIHCPAPLPEELAGPFLTKMLVPAPYKAPKKEANKKAKETRSGLRRRGASDTKSEDSSDPPSSKEDKEEEGIQDELVSIGDRPRRAKQKPFGCHCIFVSAPNVVPAQTADGSQRG